LNFEQTLKNSVESHKSRAAEVYHDKSLHFLHEQLSDNGHMKVLGGIE
jgi:hypothetical protein